MRACVRVTRADREISLWPLGVSFGFCREERCIVLPWLLWARKVVAREICRRDLCAGLGGSDACELESQVRFIAALIFFYFHSYVCGMFACLLA